MNEPDSAERRDEGGDPVLKPLVIPVTETDLQELYRVLLDEDEPAALAFLQKHLRGKLREVMEGG
jgi:hypothetical protein